MINCICRIKKKGANGTGFFCIIPLNENTYMNCLITNYHVLNEKYFKENKEINLLLNDDNETKKIDLNIKRRIYYNKEYDTTIIELKEEDNIKEYLELDDNIFKDNEDLLYEEKSIYILQYPKGVEACVSYGILSKIKNYDIIHKCSTDSGSSGSPILNLKNNKVIGIHKGSPNYAKNFNYGTLLKYPLNNFINQNKTKNDFINENIAKNKNIILGEIYINKNNIDEDIRIINSYENVNREWYGKDIEIDYKSKNEKEIKENIEITINGKIIDFTYYYKFKEEGIYIIEYSFKNNLTNTNHMFYNCNKLINLDLSNFNTQNVTNMSYMFYSCNSLTNLNLSNFNTQNVIDMGSMFCKCHSLKKIILSYFNTQNVINMGAMFCGCKSLTNLNLSNFNTLHVIDMSMMFDDCHSLKYLNLSNFNTQNATNMDFMFFGCSIKKQNIITKDIRILEQCYN